MGFKLAGGKGLREGWDSKKLWKSVEKVKGPPFAKRERWATRGTRRESLSRSRELAEA